ncbi:hypothetical protein H257_16023 [Aphanomyces astaci]|uniref:Uncharacterized protein n=1 Tax=Aphanomyces astaci TaxID=112090 RepID=W4FK65_APHAT|nr:hypothetical protein H257_16023 [Aphanomyces astaci]ETV67902.1 hypothetical protein H257_16023 [Aphanomyces astaci]|eukprot:XP_009842647.1 hypothetical protein H257_16023 [Aphanomyces astaci]
MTVDDNYDGVEELDAQTSGPSELEQSVPEVPRVRDERPSFTGLDAIALTLRNLSQQRKRTTPEGGMQFYVAKKRRSIDKFIDGAAEAVKKAATDLMSVMLRCVKKGALNVSCRVA